MAREAVWWTTSTELPTCALACEALSSFQRSSVDPIKTGLALRKFILMENVGNLLSKDMAEIREHVLQEPCPTSY